jgi:broad specificity phosphatase PhoE
MNKQIYCIRHGESVHNVNYKKNGVSAFTDPNCVDSELTNFGQEQSILLSRNWTCKYNIELILVSPLTRTLDTCMNIFGDTDIPIFCIEGLREYPCGSHTCNKRKDISFLSTKYSRIQFINFNDNKDVYWNPNEEETISSLNNRILKVKEFISKRPENNIAIVGHNSFLSKMIYNELKYIEHGKQEIKHCEPILYKI